MNINDKDMMDDCEDSNATTASENSRNCSKNDSASDSKACDCTTKECISNSSCPCKSQGVKSGCCLKCKNCLPTALSILACLLACLALSKTCHKPCIPSSCKQQQSAITQVDDSRIRTAVINVIKNDPQMLIDAMSVGIAKQRAELSKQQAQGVDKYKNELIDTAYLLGNKEAKITILCLFDPICSGCIEFQRMMLNALQNKKDVCFYIIPVAALGEKAEEVAKAYYAVYEKSPSKLVDFISAVIKDPANPDKALKSVSINSKDLEQLKDAINKKMETNLSWLDKLQINSVPAVFIKSSSGKFTPIEENELITMLR